MRMRLQPKARWRSLYLAFAVYAVIALLPLGHVSAELPYRSYTVDTDGQFQRMPDVYVPIQPYTGFSSPEDLFITATDEIYVADTGNDRIVHLDAAGRTVRVIPGEANGGEEQDSKAVLRRPEGVFVTEEGEIYVADTGTRRIAVFSADGQYSREYRTPQSELIPPTFAFMPSKLVLDRRGYMYIATKGGYQGLMQLDTEGQFVGFFGANKVSIGWLDAFKRKFYTEEQLKEEQALLPGAILNAAVDEKGFIYTVNKNMQAGQLRRLNFGGVDLFQSTNFAPWAGPRERFTFADADVGKEGFITALASSTGEIYQYDRSGALMLVFGSTGLNDERLGSFRRPTSLVTDSGGKLYVADGEMNVIQVFKRTAYGGTLHAAVDLYQKGQYEQARAQWLELQRMNGLNERAFQGLAKAEFQTGNYSSALDYFKLSKDKEGYSQSFWEIRMNWLLANFGISMTLAAGGAALLLILRALRRRAGMRQRRGDDEADRADGIVGRWRASDWRYSFGLILTLLRSPLRGMAEVADSGRAKGWVALAILLASFVLYMLGKAVVSFPFSRAMFTELDLRIEALQFFLIWLSWLLSGYLIGSIMKGEASFKKLFIVNCYAMVPFLLFHFPIQLLSNVLTLQENVIYQAAMNGTFGWMLLLMFIAYMTAENYNLKETLGVASVSLFAMACLWLFGFVGLGLFYQGIDFFVDFGREVIERV